MSDETGRGVGLWEKLSWDVMYPKNSINNQENPDNEPPPRSDSNDQTPVQIMSAQKNELHHDDEATEHMLTERKRRRKMNDMFSDLHALVSHPLPAKADKSTIIDEAVRRIKNLEEEIKTKEKQKEENLQQKIIRSAHNTIISREAFLANQVAFSTTTNIIDVGTNRSSSNGPIMFETWNFMNVVLSICGNQAQYFVCSSKKPGLMTLMMMVFDKYGVDVISAHLSTHANKRTYMLQACLNGISNRFGNSLPVVVELFKRVAMEISIVVCTGQ